MAEREHLLEDAPEISVVLCTRDRAARLADCVRQLARQEYPSYEIVVVDNAPADPNAVPAVLESLDLSVPVQYIFELSGRLGGNAGWRAAKADIIAFTDDDAVPDRYWLAEILRGFSARSKVGCVTGIVLPAELRTEPQQWFEQLGGCIWGGDSIKSFRARSLTKPVLSVSAIRRGRQHGFLGKCWWISKALRFLGAQVHRPWQLKMRSPCRARYLFNTPWFISRQRSFSITTGKRWRT